MFLYSRPLSRTAILLPSCDKMSVKLFFNTFLASFDKSLAVDKIPFTLPPFELKNDSIIPIPLYLASKIGLTLLNLCVVSSIMIAVITLISVQERTKEIGILRAMGASKHNVSVMFNAETILIGFASGALGVIVTVLLCIPINAIIHAITGINSLNAFLPINAAVVLIAISVILNLFSGTE